MASFGGVVRGMGMSREEEQGLGKLENKLEKLLCYVLKLLLLLTCPLCLPAPTSKRP